MRGQLKYGVTLVFVALLGTALLLAACSGDDNATEERPVETAIEPPDNVSQEAEATTLPAVVVTVEETPSPTAVVGITASSAVTKMATATITPSATPLPPTPTPDLPPAPHVDVEQAPYEPSDCSDKYPCNDDVDGWEARMRVPPGFAIDYFARVNDAPTSLTFGPDGRLYIAAQSGTIYTIDESANVDVYVEGLIVPTGLAFRPGTDTLYVSNRVNDINEGGEAQISIIEDGKATTLIAGLPCCYVGMHGPNGIAFGPDGYAYVGVGGRADHGEILDGPRKGELNELHPFEASILRFSPDGTGLITYARGFRNPYDIAWDANGQLYATDNGRDGDFNAGDNPPDELHLVVLGGQHGYPWFDCPVCFSAPEGVEIISPLYEFVPHAAVAGITAYIHETFPGYYNDLFVVLWSAFPGAQKVMRFGPDRTKASDFATGFALPIDITVGPAGELYVADYATGIIYRISYVG